MNKNTKRTKDKIQKVEMHSSSHRGKFLVWQIIQCFILFFSGFFWILSSLFIILTFPDFYRLHCMKTYEICAGSLKLHFPQLSNGSLVIEEDSVL